MSKKTFVVTTQALLNKATEGVLEDPTQAHYWKLAGGSTYVVHGCRRDVDALAGVVLHLDSSDYSWLEYPTKVIPVSEWDVSETCAGESITVIDLIDFQPPIEEF